MKNRPYLVCGVLLVAAAVGLLWWSPWVPRQVPEPVYDGKPLGYWATNYYEIAQYPHSLFEDSNAVPYLTKALKRGYGPVGAAVYRRQVCSRLPLSILKIMERHPLPDTRYRRARAAFLLGKMGAIAKPAIPELIRTLREDNFDTVVYWSQVAPMTEEPTVRIYAAWSLASIGQGNEAVVAALTMALKDNNSYVREIATNALWKLDHEAAAKAWGTVPSR